MSLRLETARRLLAKAKDDRYILMRVVDRTLAWAEDKVAALKRA